MDNVFCNCELLDRLKELVPNREIPEANTFAVDSESFHCVEPEFKVEEGRLVGGDMVAFARLQQIRSRENIQEEIIEEDSISSQVDMSAESCFLPC